MDRQWFLVAGGGRRLGLLRAVGLVALSAGLLACGSSDENPETSVAGSGGTGGSGATGGTGGGSAGNQFLKDETIDGFPHLIDYYVPEGATRAVVMLHGALGTKEGLAFYLGVSGNRDTPSASNADFGWLSEHSLVGVAVQGQALPENPKETTWSNYVMDSGQDDVAFLQALAENVRDRFGVTQVYLIGHSNGGMMANRMWCESPETFDAFVALSGPPSEHFLMPGQECEPSVIKPYFGMVGGQDDIIGVLGHFTEPTWTVIGEDAVHYLDNVLIGEWASHVSRAEFVCGATPEVSERTEDQTNQIDSWVACDGQLRVDNALDLTHGLGMPYKDDTTFISDMAMDFIESNVGAP